MSGENQLTTPREFEVTRSASRYANSRIVLLVIVLLWPGFLLMLPFFVDLTGIIDVGKIAEDWGGPIGAIGPFVMIALFVFVMRSVRDKPSTIRLAEGGIRPSWVSRKLFFPNGRARFHPWVPTYTDTVQGACVELWCGRRSFILGVRGVSTVDLVMDAPPKRALDCEVSRDVFFKILQGLFGTLPEPGTATPHHDISLAATSATIFRGIKDARLWMLVYPSFVVLLLYFINYFIGDFVDLNSMKWQGVVILVVLGGMGFLFKLLMNPKRLAHVLRISKNELQYRDADGRILADAPFSQVEAAKLSYRNFSILRPVWVRHFPVLKVSFSGKTLLLSCPYIGDSWRLTAKQCGPPQYDLTAYDWNKLLSALSPQLQAVSRDA